MTPEEAYKELGLSPNPSLEEIEKFLGESSKKKSLLQVLRVPVTGDVVRCDAWHARVM